MATCGFTRINCCFDFAKGALRELTKIEIDKDENRCNDGKCDAAGRLWIGTMHIEAKKGEGALYCYDGKLEQIMADISVPNGICWSKDNRQMYFIDSYEHAVCEYDYNINTGRLANKRVVITIKEKNHVPDGMTMDDEGMLWVAIWGGGCVNRYNPENGALIGKVKVSAPHVTSCSFGGENMRQLFITTARAGLNEQQLEAFPLSGSLFIVDTGTVGLGMHSFNHY